MKDSLRQQFERLGHRLHELDTTLADGSIAADMKPRIKASPNMAETVESGEARCQLVDHHVLTRFKSLFHRGLLNFERLGHEALDQVEGEDRDGNRLGNLDEQATTTHEGEYRGCG